MIPDNRVLLNIAGNFFYGDPMLYADGCQFCPSGVIQPLVLTPADLTNPTGGRCRPQGDGAIIEMTRAGANKRGEASLRQNCFTLNKQMECTANETQRSSDECLAFCSMSRELGPCDGHGACVPPQAGAAEARFTCECDDGYVPTNGTLGSTCARPAPPPAAGTLCSVFACLAPTPPCPTRTHPPHKVALSTGAVVGIAVGSAAAFALILALVVALLWPRQRRRWSDLDVCQEFSMGEILRATDNWASSNVLGKGGFATVYKGVSSKGELWAVKRIALMSNDFETKVRAMASLRHANVVRLLGFCLHQNVESGQQEQILVYEFVPNGDLKYHIHDSKTRKVQVYELGELKDAALEAPDEAVVELADIALDCLKMPASRRPNMKDVARRLQNLLSLYCGDEDLSSLSEPSLRLAGTPRGESSSFGRSDWSEATSSASKLTHSLSEKWRIIE
ncbi:unnamed protein product [Closterium sp. Naga37s-1]|nr:unnamed protein product [Closterium sp. Naga37s-1]